MSQSSSQPPSFPPQFALDLMTKFGEAVSQEVIIFFLVLIVVYLRDKTISYFKALRIKRFYFQENSINSQIKDCLVSILDLMQCDRVILFQLHNGDCFINNQSQLKCTMTHQYTATCIQPIDKIVSMPISYLYREIELLKDSNDYQWILKDEAFPRCKTYLSSTGVELFGYNVIRSKLKVPVAIIGIHYCSFDFLPIINDLPTCSKLASYTNTLHSLLNS